MDARRGAQRMAPLNPPGLTRNALEPALQGVA